MRIEEFKSENTTSLVVASVVKSIICSLTNVSSYLESYFF